jgi:hypothetical protein
VGDVLADYVDAGGKVIDFQFAIMGMLQGRFQNEGYSAMTSTYTLYTLSCLGDYDAGSLLMRGIAPGNVCDMFRGPDTALTAGSRAAARWQDGELFVAYKTNRSWPSTPTSVRAICGPDRWLMSSTTPSSG